MKHFESELTKSEQNELRGGIASISSVAMGAEVEERCTVAGCASCKESCKDSCRDGCKESAKEGTKPSSSMALLPSTAVTALPMESAATSSVIRLLR